MNHKPFEDWLFEEKKLTGQERAALTDHLALCPDCQQLQKNWQAVHRLMRSNPVLEPLPGFEQRWRSSLVRRRAVREQKRQSLSLLAMLGGSALVILLLLSASVLISLARVNVVALLIHFSVMFFLIFYEAWAFLEKIPTPVMITGWVTLTTGLLGLAVIWICSLWKVSARGGLKNE